MRSVLIAALITAGAAWPLSASADPANYYEWIAVAPLVVTGDRAGEDGKFVEVLVRDVLRGETEPGATIRVNLRRANRDRDRLLHRHATKLQEDESYVLLLRPTEERKSKAFGAYDIVRGVDGVRALPAEGADAVLQALRMFVEIQQGGNDDSWVRLREMLEETSPILLRTSLELHLKFRRGDIDSLPTVRPLLEHPQHEVREAAARLIEQILSKYGPDAISEQERLQNELASRARRDPVASVRIAAIGALDRLDGDSVQTILDEIADDDPDQTVRYTAEALSYERRIRPAKAAAGGAPD